MNFKEMMIRMLPSFGKKEVFSNIDVTRDMLRTYTIPVYNNVSEYEKKNGFKSAMVVRHLDDYKKRNGSHLLKDLEQTLNTCYELCDYIEDVIDKKFREDVTRRTLSMYTINMLKLTHLVNFVSDYTRRYLNYLITREMQHTTAYGDDKLEATKAEEKYITSNRYQYYDSVQRLNMPFQKLKVKLDEIPDILVNQDTIDQVRTINGQAKTDPLSMNGISPRYNPFMFVANRIVNYQVKKYNQAKTELEETQCKILYLRQQRQGKEDAKLDKQIEYYTDLNNKLRAEIDEMEKDYELN